MASTPWYRSNVVLLVAAVLFPPLGIVLLLIRGDMRILPRVLGALLVAAFGVAQLFLVYGLRMELDGTGARPMFSFGGRDSRDRAVERSRAEQRTEEAPESPAPAAIPQVAVEAVTPAVETAAAPAARPRDYWSDFRGPNRAGVYSETPILTDWPTGGLRELWKQPIGGGYASLVAANGVAFTIEQRRSQEVVAAYDIASGRELWTNAWEADFREAMGGDGPRATPVWHDGNVYAQGAEGELRCLDAATGRVIWNKNILTDNGAANLQWGMSNSPLIVDEKVIVTPGGRDGRSVVAYHKDTGERIWQSLDDKAAYTSPMLVTLGGKRQVLVVTASRAVGLNPEDGALLWEYPWTTAYDVNAAVPIVAGPNRFFISAGYGHGAAVVELAPKGEGFAAKTVWSNIRMKNKFNPSVLHEGHVYGLDEGILACVNIDTGDQKWKGGRYGYGQLLLAGEHLIVITETGDLVLVKATPAQHEEITRFSAISGKTWNIPAISDGVLLVRNTSQMAAFQLAP
jgi:outer membrane protein assembly factor BamB